MDSIPLSRPELGMEEVYNIIQVLRSGWLTSGKWTAQLESQLATYIGCEHVIAVNSCTSALILTLEALGITGEVILPSFTFAATANAVVLAGATPVFSDIEYHSCNIDTRHVESLVTPRTEAIMPVHFAGGSCDMAEIRRIAGRHGLAVIEDCAEALGARYCDKPVGSFGHGCFSFFPTKGITTGEGGAITTDDDDLALRCRRLRAHGVFKRGWERDTEEPGYNFRLSDVLAAIGVAQMRRLDDMNKRRRIAAGHLTTLLPDRLDLPVPSSHIYHVYQMYSVKLRGADRNRRNQVVQSLRDRGVGASVHFDPPVHTQSFYAERHHASLPVTERVAGEVITLPLFPSITERQLDYIVSAVCRSLEV